MEFQIDRKRRPAYSGASKRIYMAKGRNGREYEIEQTRAGWVLDISNQDYCVAKVIFHQLYVAKIAAGRIETGQFDWSAPKEIIRGAVCFECGGKTAKDEAACLHCGTLKPWMNSNS